MSDWINLINAISGVVMLNSFIEKTDLGQLSDDEITLLHKKAAGINSTHNCDGAISVIQAELSKRSVPKQNNLGKIFGVIVGIATVIGAIVGLIQVF